MKKFFSNSAYLFWLIFIIAVIFRLCQLGTLPSGINQDEAYAGYEALSLLTTGTDSWGYGFPLYFISWASGMNVLYSYLSIPFIALFGPHTWVIRLPQALLGILSCYIFYRLLKKIFNRQTALLGFFFSAIVPWHIMLSRWGLESNLAPFFILCGFYFFAKSLKKNSYLFLSALLYGLGLYTYATAWIYIIITFALQLLYFIIYQRNTQSLLYTLSAGILFTILAFPLLLLILINNNIIPEIKTAIFSIPKLVYYRQNEIGFDHLDIKLPALIRILFQGKDFLITNQIQPYGLFYPISLPFILLGLYKLFQFSRNDIKSNRFSFSAVILCSIIIGLIYGATLYPCINRLNFLWFNLLIALSVGVAFFLSYPKILKLIIAVYICFTVSFMHTYATKYNTLAADSFTPDLEKALTIAEQQHHQTGLTIYITDAAFIYPKVLFYTQPPTADFIKTVNWQNFPDAYLDASGFTHYRFIPNFDYHQLSTDGIYIAPFSERYWFYKFNIVSSGAYIIATPRATP